MEQTTMPFYCNDARLKEFLTRVLAIEAEQDRLREDLRGLREEYADDFPMRGVLAAVKIARTTAKAVGHPTDPTPPGNLSLLVTYVERHMAELATPLAEEALV